MTLWDCFEEYGNEIEYRKMIPNPIIRSPSLLGTGLDWEHIVEEYTRHKITKDTDRLPSLAGLAELYQKATGKHYLAGLWLEGLPYALLWHPWETLHPLTFYCAPSWSWAALKGPVLFHSCSPHGEMDEVTAKVTPAYCEYYPPGTLSTVRGGWLDIEGSMTVVTGRGDRIVGGHIVGCYLFVNNEPVYSESDGYYRLIEHRDQDIPCTKEDISRSRIYLLEVVKIGRWRPAVALVLKKVEEQSGGKDIYRRIRLARKNKGSCRHGWETRNVRLI